MIKERVDKVADPTSKGGNDTEQNMNKMKRKSAKRTSTTRKPRSLRKKTLSDLWDLKKARTTKQWHEQKVVNITGGTLHGRTIFLGLVSVEVPESLVENYNLFANVDLDDPPVTLVGKVVGHYVLWPTKFMEIDLIL